MPDLEDDATLSGDEIKVVNGTGSIDTKLPDGKPSYKSWKKKYRKMRIKFDQKMHEGESLYHTEQKALESCNRLAIEIDRLLDLLVDINSSPQIPAEKRFDLSLDSKAEQNAPLLDIDRPDQPSYNGSKPSKSLKQLLRDVPHLSHAATACRAPAKVADLEAGTEPTGTGSTQVKQPPAFLTADNLDDYLHNIDTRMAEQRGQSGLSTTTLLPTLAPAAHNAIHSSGIRDFALRNPTSVYNWLRKHEPKVFLQDGEATPADKENGDDHHTTGRGGGRKSTGEKGSRGAAGSRASKRASNAHKRGAVEENTEKSGDEADAPPPSAGARGKRKRNMDDDAGYRPKGGSSRPTKRKRRSEGGSEAVTPTARRSRKSDAAAAADADAAARED